MLERVVVRSDRLPTVSFFHGVRQTSNTRRFGRLIEALQPGTDLCAVHMAAPQVARKNDDPIADWVAEEIQLFIQTPALPRRKLFFGMKRNHRKLIVSRLTRCWQGMVGVV